jgi:hypothetical protein
MVALGGVRSIPAANAKKLWMCLSRTRGVNTSAFMLNRHDEWRGCFMKKLVLATAAVLALLSVAANAQGWNAPMGKGKAPPPPPVVTKG